MEGPPLGPGGEDTTWPDQVAPRGRKASTTRKIKPQISNLCRSAVAAPGVQGHFRLARVGDSVDGLLDVHAAARGLIQNPTLRHPVAQGGACGRVPHRGQHSVIGAGSGVSLGAPVFSGAVAPFPRGAEGGHAARRPRRFRGRAARGGLPDYLQVGVRARVLLWEVPFAASESQRRDDLVCRVQRRRPEACFAWGCRFRHCCVAVPKSRGWGADFPWLVHVLWARWGVGGGARTLAPRAGVCVLVWALGSPPAARVAWVAPLQEAYEARRSPSSGCPPMGGCQGPPPTCCEHGCAAVGAQHCPLGLHALWGLRAAGVAAVPAPAPQRGALASRRCALWGRQKGVPKGGAFRRRGELLRSGASPPLVARLLGGLPVPATRVLWARVCERGGPALSPWLACPVWGCVSRGWWGQSPGGVAFHRYEGRLVSGAVPPPAARPLGRAAGVPQPVCPGCGWRGVGAQHWPHALRAVDARRGGGGRASPGGLPFAVVRGV